MFNKGTKTCPQHQHHPEFTQSSYLRLRSLEEAFLMKNYFETPVKEKLSISQKISNQFHLNKKLDDKILK